MLDEIQNRVIVRATLDNRVHLDAFESRRLGAGDAGWMHGLRPLGRCDDVTEEIHAIRSRRGQHHPLVLQIIEAARANLALSQDFSK